MTYPINLTVAVAFKDAGRDGRMVFRSTGSLPFVPSGGQALSFKSVTGNDPDEGVEVVIDQAFWFGAINGEGVFVVRSTLADGWKPAVCIVAETFFQTIEEVFSDADFKLVEKKYTDKKPKGWNSADPNGSPDES